MLCVATRVDLWLSTRRVASAPAVRRSRRSGKRGVAGRSRRGVPCRRPESSVDHEDDPMPGSTLRIMRPASLHGFRHQRVVGVGNTRCIAPSSSQGCGAPPAAASVRHGDRRMGVVEVDRHLLDSSLKRAWLCCTPHDVLQRRAHEEILWRRRSSRPWWLEASGRAPG